MEKDKKSTKIWKRFQCINAACNFMYACDISVIIMYLLRIFYIFFSTVCGGVVLFIL